MEIRNVSLGRIVAVGLLGGLIFAATDALFIGNPLAQSLYAVYQPISRATVSLLLGLSLDLVASLVMALLFVALACAFPGKTLVKGILFGLVAWFFRVVMPAAYTLVMFRVSGATVLYTLLAGLIQLVVLGMFYGTLLAPE